SLMRHYLDTVVNQANLLVTGAKVNVFLAGTQTQAQLFSDDGLTVASQPLTTNINGQFDFYTADGRYDIQVSGAGLGTVVQRDVEIADVLQATPSGDAV